MANEVPAIYFDHLDEMERAFLAGYAQAFGDPISQLKLSQIIPAQPLSLNWDTLSPLETLSTLADLVVQLGQTKQNTYQSIYILVDCVDETSAGPQAAAALLQSLVSERTILEAPHVAFKFFLPLEVGRSLTTSCGLTTGSLVRARTLLGIVTHCAMSSSNGWPTTATIP